MNIHKRFDMGSNCLAGFWSESYVRHKMTIHNINVDPIAALLSTASISLPKFAKSADSMDGAIFIDSLDNSGSIYNKNIF